MKFTEYAVEGDGTLVNLERLRGAFLSDSVYKDANSGLVIPCHDVYIELPNENGNLGLLLVERKQEPCKGILWPIGGRILKGMPTEESLRKKAKNECGLDLENITYLGVSRVFFEREPLGHGKGQDAFGFNYHARGLGEIKLNELHSKPTILTPDQYTEEFRNKLHPYMREFMDKAMFITRENWLLRR